MSNRILKITDGAATINLLSLPDGYSVDGWRPQISGFKGGGVWQESALSDGRVLVDFRYGNIQEVIPLNVKGGRADVTFAALTDLVVLLNKAAEYWRDPWRGEPVWLERRADGETNISYALVYSGSIPDLSDLLHGPWTQHAATYDLELRIEHSVWQGSPPEEPDCVEIAGFDNTAIQYDLEWIPLVAADDSEIDMTAMSWTAASNYDSFGRDGSNHPLGCQIIFKNVNIPQGATILYADVYGEAPQNYPNNTCNAYIYAEDTSFPNQVQSYADFIGRVSTSAQVLWNAVPAFITGVFYASPDISTVIQEIVNRADWVEGGDINIFIRDNISTSGAQRAYASQEHAGRADPALRILFRGAVRGQEEPTCEDQVYVQSKHNEAQLTHIFQDDAGVWSNNLLAAALPYWLLPNPAAINDACYFGVCIDEADTGPFNNLVFDVMNAGGYNNLTWEYWNGAAWSSAGMFVRDNTNQLKNTGVNSMHFRPPSNWTNCDLQVVIGGAAPAIDAFWIRGIVLGGGGAGVRVQNRHPYTVTWPYIEVAANDIKGHIDAPGRLIVYNQSAGTSAYFYISRVIAGLRSVSRGDDFSAYLNACGEQNPTGLGVVADAGTCAETNYNLAATGRSMRWNPAGVVSPASLLYHYTFTPTLARQYYGKYHVYLRLSQDGGADGDFSFYAVLTFGSRAFELWRSPEVTSVMQTNYAGTLVDLGVMDFYSDVFKDDERMSDVLLDIYGANSNAAPGDIYFLELITMPVDECAFDTSPGRPEDLAVINDDDIYSYRSLYTRIIVDGASYPKRYVRSHVVDNTGLVKARYRTIATSPPILHPSTSQRWWFLFTKYLDITGNFEEESFPHNGATIRWRAHRRYLTSRGNQ